MATFVHFDEFKNHVGRGVHQLHAHTFKAVLTNSAPNAGTNTVLADITQIANGNGYTTGGVTLTTPTWTETGPGTGIWQFSANDFSWTASGGDIGPFRYVVIYNDTPTSPADPLIGYIDNGSSITVTDGNTVTVDIGANGITRLS